MHSCSIAFPYFVTNIFTNQSRQVYSPCGKPATKFYRTDEFITARNLTFPFYADINKGYVARCQGHRMQPGSDPAITEISEEDYSIAFILIS